MAARANKPAQKPERKAASKRTRRNGAPRPRLLRTLFSTAVLVVLGFTVGLLAGALLETPSTVLAPFRPGGQEIDLAVLRDPSGDTRPPAAGAEGIDLAVAEGSPTAAPELRVEPAAARPEDLAKRVAPAPVAAPPPAGPFVIQVGSFDEPVPAWKLAERLGEKEYEVYVDEGQAAGKPRWRVRVGPVPDQAEADRLARRLKQNERLPTWIVAQEERG